jgi:HTH-type transcriptional regulator/antitoxin HigA
MTASVAAEALAPSELLRDELDERGWTVAEFAQILGRPTQVVSEILNDRKEITPETALAIGEALGTSAELWLNLQSSYRLWSIRQRGAELTPVARRARLRSLVPVTELRRRGWLPDTDDLDDLEAATCRLLSIKNLDETPSFAAVARRRGQASDFTPAQTAWLARVREVATKRQLPPFDREGTAKLGESLAHRLRDPQDLGQLRDWLDACGIALVTELPLRGSGIDGAALLMTDRSAAIGLSTRGDRFDSVVFTLLHEMAHLVLGHLDQGGPCVDEELFEAGRRAATEKEANALAASWVFPDDIRSLVPPISLRAIVASADEYQVHPSLVIGRLQWTRRLDWKAFRSTIPRARPFMPASS